MKNLDSLIENHYGLGKIIEEIFDGLKLAGKEVDSLTVDDLSPIDEFHTRSLSENKAVKTAKTINLTNNRAATPLVNPL